MAELDLEDLSNLFNGLTTQSRRLLDELTQFQKFIATRPSAPEIHLNKFLTDVIRESNLLTHHGAALGLDSPISGTSLDEESTYTNMPIRTSLARLQVSDTTPSNSAHRIRSSNIGFLSAVWEEMKRSQGVVAVRKQVRYLPHSQPLGPVGAKGSKEARDRERKRDSFNRDRQGMGGSMAKVPRRVRGSDGVVRRAEKDPVTVDVVAEGGARWVKIVTKSTGWLSLELAKEGLVDLGDDGSEADAEEVEFTTICSHAEVANGSRGESTPFDTVKLCRIAQDFLAAARTARVGTTHEHPQVFFHLTKIDRGSSKDIDAVLNHIEQLGVKVVTAGELISNEGESCDGTVSAGEISETLVQSFERMVVEQAAEVHTDTLNVDCTILIALISDISHQDRSNILVPEHYNGRQAGKDMEYQLTTEPDNPLLPNDIYPILRGKHLVCTSKAATHLRNIVRIMGSETETKRSNLFLPVGPEGRREATSLRQSLQDLSTHNVPHDLQLPIEVVEDENRNTQSQTNVPGIEDQVRERLAAHPRLSPLNQSVFFYGWREAITTVSLNRVVSEWLDRAIDATLDDLEEEENCMSDIAVSRGFRGPRVSICGRERSLLGNEKS